MEKRTNKIGTDQEDGRVQNEPAAGSAPLTHAASSLSRGSHACDAKPVARALRAMAYPPRAWPREPWWHPPYHQPPIGSSDRLARPQRLSRSHLLQCLLQRDGQMRRMDFARSWKHCPTQTWTGMQLQEENLSTGYRLETACTTDYHNQLLYARVNEGPRWKSCK